MTTRVHHVVEQPGRSSQLRPNNPRRRRLIALLTDRIDASLTKQLVDWRLSPVIDSSHPNFGGNHGDS